MLKPLPGLRTAWADHANTSTILLVVNGHQILPWAALQFIYSVHVPFFYMISGYMVSFSKHPDARLFILHRAKTFLIPYVSLGLLTFLNWVLISPH